ncbi:MAG: hypothetical protein RL354_366 [Planctomycetota bacterium]|jgi:hypothetical protein
MKTWNLSARGMRAIGWTAVGMTCSLAASTALAGDEGGATWTEMPGYSAIGDSAFPTASLLVEDFEGLRPAGLVINGPVMMIDGDSVDADDVALDGSGALGHSLAIGEWTPDFVPGFAALEFSAKLLGGAPTRVGFVVTDSSGIDAPVPVTITVYYADGSTESRVVDVLSMPNDASDDYFIGLESAIGIDTVTVASIIPLVIDHVQYNTPLASLVTFVRDDANRDGKSDVAWFNADSRKSTMWNMDGLTRFGGTFTTVDPGAGFSPRGLGDLNADRRADLIWRETSTGRFVGWLMNNTNVAQQAYISGPIEAAWDIIALGDLDGDQRADCILRNSSTGEVRGWLMNGLTKTAGGFLGNSAGLRFLGVGDINADGKDDLLWQDSGTAVQGWLMNGLAVSAQGQIANACAPGNGWRVAGVADLDADGRADVVWHNESLGLVSGWLMDGLARRTGNYISTTVGSGWRIVATPDLNGDGKRDILWRNTGNGDVNGWLMNGLVKQSGGFIRSVPTSWSNIR